MTDPMTSPTPSTTHTMLDAAVPDKATGRTRSPLLAVVILPLFFIVVFVLSYVSAAHAPVPHNFSLTLAGPAATTSAVAAQIEDTVPGAFDLTVTTNLGSAVEQVETRSAVGAVLIETTEAGSTVTAVVASGGGRMAAGPVMQVADQVAEQLGTTALTQDVAPVSTADGAGTGVFYLLVLCTMGAYLSVTAIFQVLPGRRARPRVRAALVVSVLAPIVAFTALSFSLGALGGSAGQVAALLGVAMVYTLVVSLIAMFFNELIGRASVFAVVIFCLALNLPAAGGSVPASMLPPFWQGVNSAGFGSAAMSTFQSIIYFDGGGLGWPFVRLLIWLAGIALALTVVCFAKSRRTVSDVPAHDHQHVLEDQLENLVPARM